MAKAKTTKTAAKKPVIKATAKAMPKKAKTAKAAKPASGTAAPAKLPKTRVSAKTGGKINVKAGARASTKGGINHDLIRELANLLDETGLTEIEIDGARVRVARTPAVAHTSFAHAPGAAGAPRVAAAAPAAATPMVEASAVPADHAKHPGVVLSPMVGTAYVAAEPGAKPFVDVGTRVKAGQTLLIIEAMKTMNQIPAPRDGTVTQILFEDGQPVEFGEPLLIVE